MRGGGGVTSEQSRECQLFSFFGELLLDDPLDDRCYRNLHAVQNGKQGWRARQVYIYLHPSARSLQFYKELSNLPTAAFFE